MQGPSFKLLLKGGQEREVLKIAEERAGFTRDGFFYETHPAPVPHGIYFNNFSTGASTPAGAQDVIVVNCGVARSR